MPGVFTGGGYRRCGGSQLNVWWSFSFYQREWLRLRDRAGVGQSLPGRGQSRTHMWRRHPDNEVSYPATLWNVWRSSWRAMIAYCSRSICAQGLHDIGDAVSRQLGVQRQAEDLASQTLGRRQLPSGELGVRRLLMCCQRVVDVGGDAVLCQMCLQRVPLARLNYEQVKDALPRRRDEPLGQSEQIAAPPVGYGQRSTRRDVAA